MLDRLTQLVPGWRERSAADLGVTLVELLAYVGDQLSYWQDAVATEAYLETARRRTSLRRHGAAGRLRRARRLQRARVGSAAGDRRTGRPRLAQTGTRFYTRVPGAPGADRAGLAG